MLQLKKEQEQLPRLGSCEVCAKEEAKYTCPKCEVKSCSLNCCTIHKKELQCDGIRDRTKFKPLKEMTERDFMSDYFFLEEITHFVEARKSNKPIDRSGAPLPAKLHRLKQAANKRMVNLKYFRNQFSKCKENSTYFNSKADKIFWHIEFVFPNADDLRVPVKKCEETTKLGEVLQKVFDFKKFKQLQFYESRGIGNLNFLLKAEEIKNCGKRYFNLDCTKSLKENLAKKTIIEYPSVHITYDDNADLDVIDSDEEEDLKNETREHCKQMEEIGKEQLKMIEKINSCEKEELDVLDKIIDTKLKKEKIKIKENFEKGQSNFLFSNDSYVDALSSDEDVN